MSASKKVTIPVSIGYGLTDIMGGGAFTVIGAWLLFFYTTFVGLTPVEAASIVAIAHIVDAIVSLFMGSFTDHFYKNYFGKKFARRRFFLLVGSPLMLVYSLLWLNGMNYWFYLAMYLAFEIIAAMVLIPWETLPSEMTKGFNSRTKLSTCRMFLSALVTFLATFIPGPLIKHYGQHDANAYLINGVIFVVIFMVCVFISWKVTWERELTPEMLPELEAEAPSRSLGEKLRMLGGLFSAFAGSLLSMSIVGLPVTLLAGLAIIKYGPFRLYIFAYRLMMLCLAGFYQVCRCVLEFTPWNVFPFIPDIDEMITRQRREGLFAAVMTFFRKTTVAIATFIIGLLLQWSGFVKGSQAQPQEAIQTIAGLMFIGTASLLLIALWHQKDVSSVKGTRAASTAGE